MGQSWVRWMAERWWWWPMLGALLGAAGVWALITLRPPTYQATATALLEPPPAGDSAAQQRLARTYAQLVGSPDVISQAERTLAESLDGVAVSGSIRPGTSLLDVRVRAENGPRATRAADGLLRALAAQVQERGGRVTPLMPAVTPREPLGPTRWRAAGVGAVLGGVVVGGLALLLRRRVAVVRTLDDVARITDSPVLGVIPKSRQRGFADDRHGMIDLPPGDPVAEAYQVLHANLAAASQRANGQMILVTAAAASAGATTTAANLALALAESGVRVLLVDVNLRHPRLHRLFGVANRVGLSDLLATDLPRLAGVVVGIPSVPLYLLPTGPLPANPAALLGGERMQRLLSLFAGDADVVIIDTPPLGPLADARVLAARVDGVVLVADASRTRRAELQQAIAALRFGPAPLWGVVLNNAHPSPSLGRYGSRGADAAAHAALPRPDTANHGYGGQRLAG